MSLGDLVLVLLAALLAWSAWRGFKNGTFGFTHDPRLATDRRTTPYWFWGQLGLIICTIVLLVVGALI